MVVKTLDSYTNKQNIQKNIEDLEEAIAQVNTIVSSISVENERVQKIIKKIDEKSPRRKKDQK
jgi:prefoldin subunit 5